MSSALRLGSAAAALSMLVLTACAADREPGVPAVLVDPTPQGRAELVRAVRGALGTARVVLADDALTRDSSLIIERPPARDRQGRVLTGRTFGNAERFVLEIVGARCVLVRETDGRRWTLRNVRCRAK